MTTILQKLFPKRQPIIVVSGLPRSGTSMMMKMLEAGGIPPLTDHIRSADDDNPKGYYEFERVKKLPDGDTAWLPEARGKAVKVIAALLMKLPPDYTYRVLFMRRDLDEVLASQSKMLERRGEQKSVDDDTMKVLFQKHLKQVDAWMKDQPNVHYLNVDYNAMLRDPWPQIKSINRFLGGRLDEQAMAAVIDPQLYRQRR
ncbi:MAG: sulfotransferase family protein [Anaerolineae bacterium]|nr:MAG: sulfotransferase family protein [Anaerolineae bacterium]